MADSRLTKIGTKLVNNIIIKQSDWAETDESSSSYIQNKPEDVPSDDKVYGRQNKEWVEIKADNADWTETNPDKAAYIKNKPTELEPLNTILANRPTEGNYILGIIDGELTWIQTLVQQV